MKAVAKKCEQDYTEKQERHDMKNKQSLKLHQAQHQRQAFSPARGRFVETLTKNRQELNVQLRSLIAANPFLHTVSDEVLSIQPAAASDIREDLLLQLHITLNPWTIMAFLIPSFLPLDFQPVRLTMR